MFKTLGAVARDKPSEFLTALAVVVVVGLFVGLIVFANVIAYHNGTRNQHNALLHQQERDHTFDSCVSATKNAATCAATVYGIKGH